MCHSLRACSQWRRAKGVSKNVRPRFAPQSRSTGATAYLLTACFVPQSIGSDKSTRHQSVDHGPARAGCMQLFRIPSEDHDAENDEEPADNGQGRGPFSEKENR